MNQNNPEIFDRDFENIEIQIAKLAKDIIV